MNNLIKRKQDNPPTSFGSVIGDIFNDNYWGFDGLNTSLIPVNIEETDNDYFLELIAPGLNKKDFQISLANDLLTISFKQSEESKQENKKWVTRQYKLQEFSRTFTLDKIVNTEKISANYENGILKVIIPKNAQAQKLNRSIEIQ